MRTRTNVMVLSGHQGTVSDVKCQEVDPQVITGSMDSTVRLWDLAAGKSMGVLTHHKKSVRSLTIHPKEFTFASGSAQSIKQWKCPEGAFMQNFEGVNGIVNTLSVNEDDILFSGSDNGEMCFFDWKSGHKFQVCALHRLMGNESCLLIVIIDYGYNGSAWFPGCRTRCLHKHI